MTRMGTVALGLAVAMLAGVIAPDAATGSTPIWSVTVEVTVWRDLDDGDLFVGARHSRGLWRRDPAALAFPATSASGRFQRSDVVALTVPLVGGVEAGVEAVVWRSVADPARLWLSVRPEGWRWRTADAPLAMRAYERYERADAVSVDVPRAMTRASVAGPLAVFTAASGTAWTDAGGWGLAEDVYVLDTATGKYWRAFTQHLAWQEATAGKQLIVWSRTLVRRVALNGLAAALYEGEDIREVSVSPDGAKVAIMAEDGALTVLDTATGEALLRVGSQTELTALLPETVARTFSLGGWSTASDGIAVVAGLETGNRRTAIYALSGEFRALPPDAGNLSPDMRHAIRPHGAPHPDYVEWTDRGSISAWFWSGFDVVDVESGQVVHSVTASDDTFILPHGPTVQPDWQWPGWWPGADRFSWFEIGRQYPGFCGYDLREQQPSAEGAVTASHICGDPRWLASRDAAAWEEGRAWENSAVVGPRILDIATGEVRELAQPGWRRLSADATRLIARGGCWRNEDGQECSLFYEGRPVWNGAVEAVGVIDVDGLLPGPLLLRDAPRPVFRAPAPARGEMVGPLFAWSEAGGYETEVDSAGARLFHEQRRIVVRDEGTGRSWRVHDYRFRQREQVWRAHEGVVVWSDDALRYVTLSGEARTLLVDDRAMNVRVSPSGSKVIVSLGPESNRESAVTLVLFALPSGEELLRVESDEPRFEEILEGFNDPDVYPIVFEVPRAIVPLGWNADETAFGIACGDCNNPSGTLALDNELAALPPSTLSRGFTFLGFTVVAGDIDALSPDFQYVAAGRPTPGSRARPPRNSPGTWDAIDIVEVASGRVARTVPVRELSGDAVGRNGWGWTADGRFAWSTGDGFDFRLDRIGEGGDGGAVWLLDVETGATERLSVRAYAAWRSPPAGTAVDSPDFSVSCPAHADLIQQCAVLLDGEVVGEGRWAEAIGFVALD